MQEETARGSINYFRLLKDFYMECINEGHVLLIFKYTCQLFEIKIYHKTLEQNSYLKTTTLIVQRTELHLSKSNESHQLFLLCDGGMAASCLTTMNWKMLGWCFPTTFANLEFHPSTWLFVHLSVLCVDIPHVHGDL